MVSIFSAVAGAIAGLLFAPQSGEETRKEIKKLANSIYKDLESKASDEKKAIVEVFGEVTEATETKFESIKKLLSEKIASLKSAGKGVDKDKYFGIIEEVIREFRGDLQATKDGALKMKKLLAKDWDKVKKNLG